MRIYPKAPTLLKWSRMTSRSWLIFDKSDLVYSKTEECKNYSHTLKLKNSEILFINDCRNLGYMCLNSFWKKLAPVDWFGPITKLTPKP